MRFSSVYTGVDCQSHGTHGKQISTGGIALVVTLSHCDIDSCPTSDYEAFLHFAISLMSVS